MANDERPGDLPQVLVLGPPISFPFIKSLYSHKFHFLDPNTSSLPLHQFLTADGRDPASIRAILSGAKSPVSPEILRLLPSLGLVVSCSAGLDHIDLAECCRRGIQVTSARNVYSEDVADMAVGLLIDVGANISAAARRVRSQVTSGAFHFPTSFKLRGKRVGIVGLGSIGMETAKRLEAFGCIISYTSKNKKPLVSYSFYESIVELASTSDALVLCCALNEQTRHMVSREVMMALGREGIIVNIGRGGLIDEKELVNCLVKGEIGGAGLDVFEKEPHVPQELFELDNVVLSPHAAALTTESKMGISQLVAANLEAFFSSKPLLSHVRLD
ncbi:glyoxylate/hydroxypyruvate reductase HPR3-like [Prosopis cineraria]|uniref:glyoxylate/hydroxypyruvate reductase HPR3-like n=1 Tax=Prosopis cineraria TaxID=364024 RepID=UPI00240ECF92|nr:glyoxylate/hydroxypyruvate reductase HPR3-like [Prosopis cineraria]